MFVLFQFLYFWFISKSPVYGSHAVIGNYKFSPNDCGITSRSEGYDDMCFQWHKSPIGLPSNRIYLGRNVTRGEVPWMATITCNNKTHRIAGPCGGSLITSNNLTNSFWVITVAHCLGNSTGKCDYRVYLGQTSLKDYYYGYVDDIVYFSEHFNDSNGQFVDLALLKLRPGGRTPNADPFTAICLPSENLVIEKYEYAFIAGWGANGTDVRLQREDSYRKRTNSNLTVGHIKLLPYNHKLPDVLKKDTTSFMGHGPGNLIFGEPLDNHSLVCSSDSGGPLWQYYRGRAVLIGIIEGGVHPADKVICLRPNINPKIVVFMDVSKLMYWIEKTINSYKN